MIKRISSFVRELTLTQQFVGIVLTFIAFIVVFFYIYINENVDTFVHRQMDRVLATSQDSYVFTYENNDRNPLLIINHLDPTVSNAIFVDNFFYPNASFLNYSKELQSEINSNRLTQVEEAKTYISQTESIPVIYRILNYDESTSFVTILNDEYRNDFKNSLLSTVINVILLVLSLLVMFLMLWVLYIIGSLRQLQNFIEKIRKNEPAKLRINNRGEIGQVADALVIMNEEIKKQEQIKEELLQNISHDLKTPIATIKSYSESIKDGVYPYKTLENSIDVIIEHANRLEKKVYNLLLLNRIGYLTTTKDTGFSNMKRIIEKTILSIKVIRPEVVINHKLIDVNYYGDEEPWRVAIENILDNALRYAKSEINIVLSQDLISIENDGSSLTSEWKEKMFRAYEKGNDGSFGLGLTIAYKVVDAYGFRIYGENSEKGVIFVIEPKNTRDKRIKKVK